MNSDVDLIHAPEVLTAVVRDTVPPDQLSSRIIPLFDQVYAFLPASGIAHPGLNTILYLNDRIDLEAGVQISARFSGSDTVHCSALPAGLAAHTAHYGPYNQLGAAHQAVIDWCRAEGLKRTGVRWEVYGHWQDDPALLRTDVYYLLQEDRTSP